jgi:hypothetical protein
MANHSELEGDFNRSIYTLKSQFNFAVNNNHKAQADLTDEFFSKQESWSPRQLDLLQTNRNK